MKRFLCFIILLSCPFLLSACSNDGMIKGEITSVKVNAGYQNDWITYSNVEKIIKLDDNIIEIHLKDGVIITASMENVIIYSK